LKLDLCKIKVLLDSGSSGSIILAKFVNKATYCHDNKLNSDDDDEQHQIELPLKLDLEDIKVSENYNLSNLHQPQTKHAKTHHLCPITTAFVET
jgi:hypothetical protein